MFVFIVGMNIIIMSMVAMSWLALSEMVEPTVKRREMDMGEMAHPDDRAGSDWGPVG